MKKALSFLLVVCLLCALTACGSQPAAPIDPIAGYVYYSSEEHGVQFQYPEEWQEMSKDVLNDPEMLAEMEAKTGLSRDVLEPALQTAVVCFYDLDAATEAFTPSYNLVVAESGGLTESAMKSGALLKQLKEQTEQQYTASFDSFTWLTEPKAEKIGNHTVVTYTSQYSMGTLTLVGHQTIAVYKDKSYVFTYSAIDNAPSAETLEQINTIIGSIEFL